MNMEDFFQDDGMLQGDADTPLETWNDFDAPRSYGAPRQSHSFMSDASPSRAGVAIRGSPISSSAALASKAEREVVASTPSQKVEKVQPSKPNQSTWRTPSNNNGGVRIRIGSGGKNPTGSKSSVNEINSVLRGSPVMTRSSAAGFPHPTALRTAPGVNQNVYTGVMMPPASADLTTPASARRAGVGKENADNEHSTEPCKCKKSKCLKLYCECFAAEKYCFDCKCTNCQNTPQWDDIRKKAIADTKAKNPAAFKPRISESETKTVSHATGCKCKKSACLK
jgi:hypothetical protein